MARVMNYSVTLDGTPYMGEISYTEMSHTYTELATGTTNTSILMAGVTSISTILIHSSQTITLRLNSTTGTAIPVTANTPMFIPSANITAVYVSNASGSTANINLKVYGDSSSSVTAIEYNVINFGATGDGVTDDSAAIQACHDAMPASRAIMYFPPGIYIIGTTITITKPYLTLRCDTESEYSTILKASGAIGTILDFADAADGGAVVGLLFQGDGAAYGVGATVTGISLTNAYDFLFRSVSFVYCNICLYTASQNVRVSECQFSNYLTYGWQIAAPTSNDTRGFHCGPNNYFHSGATGSVAIYTKGATNCSETRIFNCDWSWSGGQFFSGYSHQLMITDNLLARTKSTQVEETDVGAGGYSCINVTDGIEVNISRNQIHSRYLNVGLTRATTTATATTYTDATDPATATPIAHGYVAGDYITIRGSLYADFNGTFVIATAPTTSTFTYVMAGTPAGDDNGVDADRLVVLPGYGISLSGGASLVGANVHDNSVYLTGLDGVYVDAVTVHYAHTMHYDYITGKVTETYDGVQKLGFFTTAAIEQPALAADPTAAQISTALHNLGLVS